MKISNFARGIPTHLAAFLAGGILFGGSVLAATTMVQAQKGNSTFELNGQPVGSAPKLVYDGTTYVQLYTVEQALNKAGVSASWNGSTNPGIFSMTTSGNSGTVTSPPEDVAKQVVTLSEHQQWQSLYKLLDPDVTAKYTEAQFESDRQANGGMFMLVKNFTVGTATTLPTWTDSTGTGKTYSNVAEVPLTLTMDDGSNVNASIHLAKAPDGTWRYFWAPSN